jgi:predicted CoA-binding protein
VFPVNPKAETFDGDPCYPTVKAIPGGVDGAVVVVKPEVSTQVVKECAEAGIKRVWMHRSLVGGGSVSQEAVDFGREKHMQIIAGGCPMMFCEPVDFGHKCMKWLGRWAGKVPV